MPQAGRLLGVSRASAYKAARNGQLPVIRIGKRYLVLKDLFEELLAGRRRCFHTQEAADLSPVRTDHRRDQPSRPFRSETGRPRPEGRSAPDSPAGPNGAPAPTNYRPNGGTEHRCAGSTA